MSIVLSSRSVSSKRLRARLFEMLKTSLGLKLYVGIAIAAALYHVLDHAVGL